MPHNRGTGALIGITSINPLVPRQPIPALEVDTVGGGTWRLSDKAPENFTLVVFYRGLHCPICSRYMGDLEAKLGEFSKRGVEVVAVSSDSEARAAEAKENWGLADMTVGYGLDLDATRQWGL